MEDCENTKKRDRVELHGSPDSSDSAPTLPESKRSRVELPESVDSELTQEDLLSILEGNDSVGDRDSEIQDLDSVIKSFEEEILLPTPPPPPVSTEATLDSGESQPYLEFLLGASDDELGLPPPPAPPSSGFSSPESREIEKTLGFENEFPSFDSYEIGEFMALGGLFDFPDAGSELSAMSDALWRPESMPAMWTEKFASAGVLSDGA
ncbi:hypothetical protein RJ641_009570 [Dillenia turbinata]|uniref:Uncharacterized protein n=1 Tax=Dillenia turbinata TaxID=194707 RepID=A0AAN8Z3M2_9MAGN